MYHGSTRLTTVVLLSATVAYDVDSIGLNIFDICVGIFVAAQMVHVIEDWLWNQEVMGSSPGRN